MFCRKTIITGIISTLAIVGSAMLAPAMAAGGGFGQLVAGSHFDGAFIEVGYRDVPIRRIHRNLRQQGLYPITDYWMKRGEVILKVENDYGEHFRVVADARYGDIIRIRQVRTTRIIQQQPWQSGFFDDWYEVDPYPRYRPGKGRVKPYDRRVRRDHKRKNKVHKPRRHKTAKSSTGRYNKKHRQSGRVKQKSRNVKQNKRRTAKAFAARSNKKHRQSGRVKQRFRYVKQRPQRPYIDMSSQIYRDQQFGGGK